MGARIDRITIDCADAPRMATFWAAALGYAVRNTAGNLSVFDPSGQGPELGFQVVPEPKVVKNRLHLDLLPAAGTTAGHWEAEIARLEEMGAQRVHFFDHDPTQTWWVMHDPEGNEFCLVWLHDEARS